MPHPDAQTWNARYTGDSRYIRRSPRALVTAHLDLIPPDALILDTACGTTPTGFYLARRGRRVVGLDVAESALRQIQPRVRQEALPVSLAVMDLLNPWLPRAHFDVILNFYFLSREIFPTYRKTLKSGGLLFFETFLYDPDLGMNPDHFLRAGELQSVFGDWEVIHFAEQAHSPAGKRRVAQLLARKPKA